MTSSLKYQWAGWLIGRVQLLIAKQSSLQSRSPQPAKIKVQDVKVHLSWFLVGDLYDKSPDKSASFIHLGTSLILLISIGFSAYFIRHDDLPLFRHAMQPHHLHIGSFINVKWTWVSWASIQVMTGIPGSFVVWRDTDKRSKAAHTWAKIMTVATYSTRYAHYKAYIGSLKDVEWIWNVVSFNASQSWRFKSSSPSCRLLLKRNMRRGRSKGTGRGAALPIQHGTSITCIHPSTRAFEKWI